MSSNEIPLANEIYDDIESSEVEVKTTICSFLNRPVFRFLGRNITWVMLIIVAIIVFLIYHNFQAIKQGLSSIFTAIENTATSALESVEDTATDALEFVGIPTEVPESSIAFQPMRPSGDVARMFAHNVW